MNEPTHEQLSVDLNALSDIVADMSDEDAAEVIKNHIPKVSNNQMRRYMQLMSNHTPGREIEKAKQKAKNRAKNKEARKARKKSK